MIDVNKLKARWVEKGMTQADVSEGTGISKSKLYRCMKTGKFCTDDISALMSLLDISAADATAIFLAKK